MESAFGIEHGYPGYEEIEKFSFAGVGTKLAQGAVKSGNMLRRTGAADIRGAKPMSGALGGMRNAAGRGQMKLGGALKRLGGGMAARPGLTGGLAAGGGAAGLGAAGGAYANRKRF